MPKRSNEFQKLVYLLHEHFAGEARVIESQLLIDRQTDGKVEVDS